jgi:hypothetical protein
LADSSPPGGCTSEGTAAVSLATLSTILAKLIAVALGDKIEPRYLWAGFTLILPLGLFLFVHARGGPAIYPFAICLGTGFGGMLMCLMAVLATYYGAKAYPFVVGLALVIQTSVAALSPYIVGNLYDPLRELRELLLLPGRRLRGECGAAVLRATAAASGGCPAQLEMMMVKQGGPVQVAQAALGKWLVSKC